MTGAIITIDGQPYALSDASIRILGDRLREAPAPAADDVALFVREAGTKLEQETRRIADSVRDPGLTQPRRLNRAQRRAQDRRRGRRQPTNRRTP